MWKFAKSALITKQGQTLITVVMTVVIVVLDGFIQLKEKAARYV